MDLTGVVPGYTNPVPDPVRRIDYIFITPDLEASVGIGELVNWGIGELVNC